MDLNIERGEIEQPLKPMLRIATPVFDNAGRKRGIVLVNFFGRQVFDRLASAYKGSGEMLLVNSDGYFLKGYAPADEWRFMYPDRTGGALAEREPAVWRQIQAAERGSMYTETGLFSFRTVRPIPEADTASTGASQAYARSVTTFDDLLTYSRVTTTAQPRVPADLEQIAREVLGDLETRIEELNGTVTLESLPTIDADPMQMRQLFQNLIGNALKFHQPDVPPRVTVSGCSLVGSDTVEITVTDNGIGFEAKHAERVFGTFQRLHGRSEEGTGIGLSVCRKIAQRHHGRIIANSEPGQGTTFTIVLPAKQPEEYRDAA